MKDKFNHYALKVATFATQKLGNNHRYIKQDGSGFHSSKLKSFFERPEFTAGAIATTIAVGMTLLKQGNLDIATVNMADCMIQSIGGIAMYHICKSSSRYSVISTHKDKAIDTKGSTLERAQLSALDLVELLIAEKTCKLHSAVETLFLSLSLPLMTLASPVFILFTACSCNLAEDLGKLHRAHMLLKGHLGDPQTDGNGYVFCDKPPAKKVKEKKSISIFGGATNPSP